MGRMLRLAIAFILILTVCTAEVCKKKIDIGVLMDGTISVRWKNFKIMRQFVGDVTKGFKIGQDFAVFGIMQFGRNGMMEFRFDETEYWDSTKLEKRIKEIKFARANVTRTDNALKDAEAQLFCDTCGVRADAVRYLIILTDGKTNPKSDPLDEASRGLKENKNVLITAVGVGPEIEREELVLITGSENQVVMIDDFTELQNLLYHLEKICPVDGEWGEWGAWQGCTASCNGGTTIRERECSDPTPANGGKDCVGNSTQEVACNVEPCPEKCKEELEVGMILDSTQSVGMFHFQATKLFSAVFSLAFNVSKDNVHFGMIHYGINPYLDFKFDEEQFWNHESLAQKILTVKYEHENRTRTDRAFEMAEKELFCDTCGTRSNAPRVLIIVTDGNCHRDCRDLGEATKVLKEVQNVEIVAIGVGGGVSNETLLKMATSEKHIFHLNGQANFLDDLVEMVKVSCIGGDISRGK